MSLVWTPIIVVAAAIGIVLASYIVEALRPSPTPPESLSWAKGIPVGHAALDGVRVRFIKTGSGPNLVLLHTLRTQIDVFAPIVPALAERFTVYAFDFPGHGWSDIPEAAYAPEDFYRWTAAFLEKLKIEDACLVGLSIGATIALVLAARGDPRVGKVIAINPYDYGRPGGLRRSSLAARLVLSASDVPVLGATFMRLRNRFVSDRIFAGGLARRDALPADLAKEFYEVGARPGHYRAFLSLLAHERLWAAARAEYPRIAVPVLLVYGAEDWATPPARAKTRSLIANVESATVPGGSHFLSLDRPREVSDLIRNFAAGRAEPAVRSGR
jgi:pimeloyl-ACP methyl ester carboxylesterase